MKLDLTKLCFLILAAGFSCVDITAQNNSYQQFPGDVEMVKLKKNQNSVFVEDTVYKNAGIFFEGEMGFVRIKNRSDQNYFLSVIDIQPDNKINVLTQIKKRSIIDNFIKRGETKYSPRLLFTPPYGIEKFLVIFSKSPIYIAEKENPSIYDRTEGGIKYFNEDELLQNVKWILEGKPSFIFSDCYFSISDLVILPSQEKTRSAYHPRIPKTGSASVPFNFRIKNFPDTCNTSVAEPEQLYISYPLLDFIQPLQSGASRSEPVDEVSSKTFVLKGRAMALKGIKQVMINDQPAIVNLVSYGKYAWEEEVELKNGNNHFTVTAITTDGKINCESLNLKFDSIKNHVAEEGKNYLLLIGVNDYQNWRPLNGAINDLDSLKKVLVTQFGFSENDVVELRNKMASRDAIDSVFRNLIRKVKKPDNVLVFFAGHGTLDKEFNEGYWIPAEARKQHPNDYISNSVIKKYLEAIDSKHTLIIADACFSGGFFKTTRGDSYEDKIEKMRSRWVFCSGREEVVSDQMTGKTNSPFTYYLVKFLKESSNQLALSELVLKVKAAVAGNSNQVPVAGPVMNTGDEGGEFVFRKKK